MVCPQDRETIRNQLSGWNLAECGWDLAEWSERLTTNTVDSSILRHSGIWGAADEAVFNYVLKNKSKKSPITEWVYPTAATFVQSDQVSNLLHRLI